MAIPPMHIASINACTRNFSFHRKGRQHIYRPSNNKYLSKHFSIDSYLNYRLLVLLLIGMPCVMIWKVFGIFLKLALVLSLCIGDILYWENDRTIDIFYQSNVVQSFSQRYFVCHILTVSKG